jgi:hypothetical protein
MIGYQKDIRDLNDFIAEMNRAKSDLQDKVDAEEKSTGFVSLDLSHENETLGRVIDALESARRGLRKLQEDYHS